MSSADRTKSQRRLRRVGIALVIYRVAERDNGSQGLETVAQLGAIPEEPPDLQSVLCEDDQNFAEFAIDAWGIQVDDYDVDLSTESHMEQMELDEQPSSVPDVSTPFDMFICIPKNVFTPFEILSFMFLNTCRETGSSVNDANHFFYFVNHALKELGGRGKSNSNKAALALAKREISFSPVVEYETCARGCQLFDVDDDQTLMFVPYATSNEMHLRRHKPSMCLLHEKLLNS
ncbi:hypothetical protein EDC96DRAFT_597923 [Choanephora cucurbitarum]|nr:hypothetical protein EDC96DRAFT_597923 [Choanephora cucurbitarum]